MYRARVEQVDGTRVRAGGKWLTCIGNRNVRVGDFVQTDGRCVYGHEIESSTPLVITKEKEELGIPIETFSPTNLYTYFPLKRYLKFFKNGYTTQMMINDYKGSAYFTNTSDTVALNIDKTKNFFRVTYKRTPNDQYGNFASSGKAIISKNNKALFTIDLLDLTNATISQANQYLKQELKNGPFVQDGETVRHFFICHLNPAVNKEYDPGYTLRWIDNGTYKLYQKTLGLNGYRLISSAKIVEGFIENENRWSFIAVISAETESETIKRGDLSDPAIVPAGHYNYELELMTGGVYALISRVYLINETGQYLLYELTKHSSWVERYENTRIISIKIGEINYGSYNYYNDGASPINVSLNHFEVISSGSGLNQPIYMQDDYYFIINSITKSTDTENALPDLWNVSIYAPNGELIITENFKSNTYFTVYRLKEKLFLIGARSNNPIKPTGKNYLTDGLYLCNKGKEQHQLEKILDYSIANQRLRPMKKINHWYEHIQRI